MKKSWLIAFKNLRRNLRRTLSTGFAVVFGYSGLCLLGGYILKTEKTLRAQTVYINHLGHISIYRQDAIDRLISDPRRFLISQEELRSIEEIFQKSHDKIERWGGVLLSNGLLSTGSRTISVTIKSLDPELADWVQAHPFALKWSSELIQLDAISFYQSWRENPSIVSITPKMGELVGVAMPFHLQEMAKRELTLAGRTVDGDLNAVNVTLGPIHATGFTFMEDTSLVAPLKLVQELIDSNGVSFVSVFLKENVSVQEMLKFLKLEIQKRGLKLEIFPFNHEKVGLYYVGSLSFLLVIAAFFVTLIFGAVLLAIANSLTMGILERLREIGTLRTIGFSVVHIRSLFVKEAVLLTGIGILLGIILSESLSLLINSLNIRFRPAGVSGDVLLWITPEPWLNFVMAIPLLVLVIATSWKVSGQKAKERLVVLLMESGGS